VLRSGGDYTAEHVRHLQAACSKFAPAHDFICLSDVKVPGCTTLSLQHPEWSGWWSKMELFGPLLPDKPTLFFDLDTMLVGDIQGILNVATNKPFVILRDVYRGRTDKEAMQSSVMYWSHKHSGVYDAFVTDSAAVMQQMRGDQDFLEHALKGRVSYFQDLTLGFSSYKADVLCRGILPKDRVIVFHGKPRPWQQDLIPYGTSKAQGPLVLRQGFVVPSDDTKCLTAALAELKYLDSMIAMCGSKRTAIQAGGSFGIWPLHLAKSFLRVITCEPDDLNFKALSINTGDVPNIKAHQSALGSSKGRASLKRTSSNAGAHYIVEGDDFEVASVDSFGVKDCDLLQLDIEGYEHEALIGAKQTIEASRPLISLELKGLGDKYGHTNQDTIELLQTWGYKQVARFGRDLIFKHQPKPRAVQFSNMPSTPPVAPDESCLLVGNGPSAVLDGNGKLVDSFSQVIRFNQFKVRGFEHAVGEKTTLWATFGRGVTPLDDDVKPDRAIFIHGDNGDPAWEMRELWRIPLSYYNSIIPEWEQAIGTRGNKLLPSTGFLVASWLLSQGVKQIHLLGFDHFEKNRSSHHHYWVPKAFKKPQEHDGGFEASIFRRWESEGRVVYLKPTPSLDVEAAKG